MNDVLSEYRAGDSSDRAEQMLVVCDWIVCGSMGCVLVRGIGRVCWPNGILSWAGFLQEGPNGGILAGICGFSGSQRCSCCEQPCARGTRGDGKSRLPRSS